MSSNSQYGLGDNFKDSIIEASGGANVFPNKSISEYGDFYTHEVMGEIDTNVNFFDLYGISKYIETDKESSTFLGYIPIEISTTKFNTNINSSTGFADAVDEEDDSGLKVKSVLPWKPQESEIL